MRPRGKQTAGLGSKWGNEDAHANLIYIFRRSQTSFSIRRVSLSLFWWGNISTRFPCAVPPDTSSFLGKGFPVLLPLLLLGLKYSYQSHTAHKEGTGLQLAGEAQEVEVWQPTNTLYRQHHGGTWKHNKLKCGSPFTHFIVNTMAAPGNTTSCRFARISRREYKKYSCKRRMTVKKRNQHSSDALNTWQGWHTIDCRRRYMNA